MMNADHWQDLISNTSGYNVNPSHSYVFHSCCNTSPWCSYLTWINFHTKTSIISDWLVVGRMFTAWWIPVTSRDQAGNLSDSLTVQRRKKTSSGCSEQTSWQRQKHWRRGWLRNMITAKERGEILVSWRSPHIVTRAINNRIFTQLLWVQFRRGKITN